MRGEERYRTCIHMCIGCEEALRGSACQGVTMSCVKKVKFARRTGQDMKNVSLEGHPLVGEGGDRCMAQD